MLLADGVITPSITVVSAIEGLHLVAPNLPILPIALTIIAGLFIIQQFGTKAIGKSFGPMMVVWFAMLAIVGGAQIPSYWGVLHAFNPLYAWNLLVGSPQGFLLLGAVFLCTTGAEALYSDLGHCGRSNIRISWTFVKTSLLLNYLGQGAWMLNHPAEAAAGANPFFFIMPDGFILPGIIIATAAAIIASQALISGSYTIIGEAIHLNFWPKVRIRYPSIIKGQLYIPSINLLLWIMCTVVVLLFQDSARMEAAYGLSITITMLMTTALMIFYLRMKKTPMLVVSLFALVYLIIEGSFLISNLNKFVHGGWFTLLLGSIIISIMLIWYKARSIKNRFIENIEIAKFEQCFKDLQSDEMIPKYASNLVYVTRSDKTFHIERKIIYSIFFKQPKRADHYWLIRVRVDDEPYTLEHKITDLIPDVITRVDFNVGFRVEPRINLYFRKVLAELIDAGKLDPVSHYPSLRRHQIPADFRYIVIDRVQTYDFDFPLPEQWIMDVYEYLRRLGISDIKQYGLDTSNVETEKIPLRLSDAGFH